jgi:hypothetical protein
LGNGSGGFGPLVNFAAGDAPYSVAVGDFNGDGRPDLAMANFASDNVSVLLGNGNGGFSPPVNFAAGDIPQDVVVRDFNNDGKPDLAVANSGSDNVSVLINCAAPANTPPTVAAVIPPQTATVGQPFNLSLTGTFTDAQTPNGLTLSASGLPSGLSLAGTTITGMPSVSGVSSVTLMATDPGSLTATTTFTLTVNPAEVVPPPPGAFAITDVTGVSCATVTATERQLTFTPQYAGLNGQPVSFSVVSEMLPTTNAGPYTLRLYTDNPTITLKATQAGTPGEASFVYNWLAVCSGGGARLGAGVEPTAKLQVNLLGNPVRESVEVDITGGENRSLQLSLTDMTGRIIDQRQTERAGPSEHYRFDVSTLPAGTLLLRTSSGGQSQTVRVLKVN